LRLKPNVVDEADLEVVRVVVAEIGLENRQWQLNRYSKNACETKRAVLSDRQGNEED